MTTPFLQSVAEAYLHNEPMRLIDCCFVFPNKRSATYFTHYMTVVSRRDGIRAVHHATTTIVDFTEGFSDTAPGERMELIFILYNVYREVVRRHHGASEAAAIDFNKFVFWADVLLNDFDDVDNSLADTGEVFRNVESLKEISSNYLTPEQLEIIKKYWDNDKIPDDVREFWNHVAYPSSENGDTGQTKVSVGFLKLWQVMGEVYNDFCDRLGIMGLHTSGMAYRHCVDVLNDTPADKLPFKRYVFVGFNNLSTAEKRIFSRLRDLRDEETGESMADFYWDVASPAFADSLLAGARIVSRLAKEFPPKYDCIGKIDSFPKIDVIGVPSRVGQTKIIGSILGESYPPDTEVNEDELSNTAVILPEENMLTPLLHSLPANITPLNLTMGYKLRNTAVAGLLRDIVSMQMRSYQSKVADTFFYEDVVNVLSHPLIRAFKPVVCTLILLEMQEKRLFNVPDTLFKNPRFSGLEPVFRRVADKNNSGDVFQYIENLLDWLEEAVKNGSDENKADDAMEIADDEVETASNVIADRNLTHAVAMQEAFLRRYRHAMLHLKKLCVEYLSGSGVYIEDATVFNLIEKLVQGEMLNFEGVPLKGLQIMGVLEARALDFDTVILPSMNERVFPRARFTGSFIPVVLRNAYGLPTPEDQENVYTYFFYRMISRARRVFLLYDARSTGLKSRQMSRYIHQLAHIFRPPHMRKTVLPYSMSSPETPAISVAKTPEIMSVINRYRSEKHPLYLSASSIKQYVGCPMAFYFEKIAHYKREDEVNDYIDESTLGTIVHDVFEKLYGGLIEGRPEGVLVTADMLATMRKDVAKIDRLICRSINYYYRKMEPTSEVPLSGETKIIGVMIKEYVREVLRKEQAQCPFVYLHGEWEEKKPLTLVGSDGKTMVINFNCRIDRIDRYEGDEFYPRIRIIDYKTGSDDTEAADLEQMFHDYRKKAFMQVMLYAQAYSQFTGCELPVQPMIFAFKTLMVAPLAPLKGPAPDDAEQVAFPNLKQPGSARSNKWNILDAADYAAGFNDKLLPYLEDLFNPEVPFTCSDNEDTCKYCAFTAICRRERKR